MGRKALKRLFNRRVETGAIDRRARSDVRAVVVQEIADVIHGGYRRLSKNTGGLIRQIGLINSERTSIVSENSAFRLRSSYALFRSPLSIVQVRLRTP